MPTVPGIYTVRWLESEQPPIRFSVNLIGTQESNIAPAPTLALSTSGNAPTESGLAGEARAELWRPLLLVGLLLLVAEWLRLPAGRARARSPVDLHWTS